jgi:hypothetical protein
VGVLRVRLLSFVVAAWACMASVACAQGESEASASMFEQDMQALPLPGVALPFAEEVRLAYYERLRRAPTTALLWELLLPGAGSVYTGLYPNAAITASLSLLGAALWIAGAVRDNDALWWSGMGTFAGARVYGVVSAPLGARWLNAAFRRHFGLTEPKLR